MGMEKVVAILCSSLAVVSGFVSLTCDSLIPIEGSDLACSCVSDGNIDWLNGTDVITTCNTLGACSFVIPEYSFSNSAEGSNYVYDITILSFNFYSCGNYACQLFGTTTSSSVQIGITSGCVSDGVIEWLNGTDVISACNTAGLCTLNPAGYSFDHGIEGSNSVYKITKESFNFYSCGDYACQIYLTTTNTPVHIGITSELDTSTPPAAVEPTAGNDGTVTVTTSCISPSAAKGIKEVRWNRVLNNVVSSVLSTNIQTNELSCDSSCGFKQQTQYTYTQPTDNSTAEEVNLRVTIFTQDNREFSWTSTNTYVIEKEFNSNPNMVVGK